MNIICVQYNLGHYCLEFMTDQDPPNSCKFGCRFSENHVKLNSHLVKDFAKFDDAANFKPLIKIEL
jgi:hypothetical protein